LFEQINLTANLILKTYHGLIAIRGIGAQVMNTVTTRKYLRPHTSDKAPNKGALKNDKTP